MTPYKFRNATMPARLQESLEAYVNDGRPTGQFLQACIENDLQQACGRADDESLAALPIIVSYLYNEAPQGCWGHKGAFINWITEKHIQREQRKEQQCPQS